MVCLVPDEISANYQKKEAQMSYFWFFVFGIMASWAWVHYAVAKRLHDRISDLEDQYLWHRASGGSTAPDKAKE